MKIIARDNNFQRAFSTAKLNASRYKIPARIVPIKANSLDYIFNFIYAKLHRIPRFLL